MNLLMHLKMTKIAVPGQNGVFAFWSAVDVPAMAVITTEVTSKPCWRRLSSGLGSNSMLGYLQLGDPSV
jgi:hypothetical protein